MIQYLHCDECGRLCGDYSPDDLPDAVVCSDCHAKGVDPDFPNLPLLRARIDAGEPVGGGEKVTGSRTGTSRQA